MKQLKIKTHLSSAHFKIEGMEAFVGKDVEIVVSEAKDVPSKKTWKNAGTVNLNGKLDNLNIRDFAHD